jgi:hypothetical protein
MPLRRLCQHNNLLKGGARRTTRTQKAKQTFWQFAIVIAQVDWREALRLEWHWKRALSCTRHKQSVYLANEDYASSTWSRWRASLPHLPVARRATYDKLLLALARAQAHLSVQ